MTPRCLVFVAIVLAAGPGVTAEPGETTDDALLRRLLHEEPERPATEPTNSEGDERASPADTTDIKPPAADVIGPRHVAAERIITSLRDAERGLSEGKTDESTRMAQQAAIAEMAQLIDAVKRRPPPAGSDPNGSAAEPVPNASGGTPVDPMPGGDPAGGLSGPPSGTPGRNRDGRAEESSDRRPEQSDPADVARSFRSDVVRDAWGHLPKRLRDQLLNAGADEYLPQYDSLVRRYYESLAWPDGDGAERSH